MTTTLARRGMPYPIPNRPTTSTHSIRVPDEEWDAAKAAANANGVYLIRVIEDALRAYVSKAPKGDTAGPAKRSILTPDKAPVRNRVVRVEDRLWADAMAAADERGEHLAEVIRRALRAHVARSRRT